MQSPGCSGPPRPRLVGQFPSAQWYIVNQFIERDPGTRPRPLASNTAEASEFAADSGLVVDTIDLFTLLMDVRPRDRRNHAHPHRRHQRS
jgi:hypothetical protein